jgi:drug/metabolite transporter (DMT)-like permease
MATRTSALRTTAEGLALAAALVTVVVWASAFIAIRAAGDEMSPGPLSLGRLLVGSVVLGVVVAARRERLPPRADIPRLVLCGLLWFAAYNVVLNAAEQRVDAGTAAMLVNVGPVLIAVLAGLVLREGFPRALLAGCVVAYAGGVVAQKPLLERTSALQVTFLACAIGALACLPYAPALVDDVRGASSSAVAWTIYLGAIPTALGFTLWAYALRRTTAGRMGATTYLVPPLAILMGWLFLDETPPALALAGGALCLTGVAIARGIRVRRTGA